jgi:hypothetical protein
VRGTGAEVEGRIEIGVEPVIAKEVVTPALAIAISIILHGRHLRALPALALIYLTPPTILLWIDTPRAVRLVPRQDLTPTVDQIILDHPHQATGTITLLDRWTETDRCLGVTSRPLHPRQRESEPAVHHLTAHVAHSLLGARPLANRAKDATEVPRLKAEAGSRGVVLPGVVLPEGDHLVDVDRIVGETTAAVLEFNGRAGPNHLDEIEKFIIRPTDVLVR